MMLVKETVKTWQPHTNDFKPNMLPIVLVCILSAADPVVFKGLRVNNK